MSNRILIIDDEEHIRRMMRLTLEAAGYEVGEAADGPQGLEMYGDGSNWQAVVLDQRMPGMDGLETLRQMRERDDNASVVMATAYASIELAVDAMKLGASDFLRKPMTPETLRNAVRALLTRGAATSGVAKQPRTAHEATTHPAIHTVTMNGFSILDPEEGELALPDRRVFTVITPNGTREEVLVQIDEEAIGYVERHNGKAPPAESSYWTDQARRLLSDYLWKEGDAPHTRSLVLKEIDRNQLSVAEHWPDE